MVIRVYSESQFIINELKLTKYNYYPNKKKLYAEIITKSWEATLKKEDDIMDIDSKEKIKEMITTLYEETVKRQGIGKELIKDINNNQGIKLDDNMQKKLAQTILILTITFINENKNEKDQNIKFIIELLECTYSE
ncbi:hypothetical protein [Tepidibacter sp. Z1-5]|uniref:hypothetical protein n=1 Tax=Tepidibacter sp. Z1-5 TaxID=3134138 RepID=UPI0030C4EAA1